MLSSSKVSFLGGHFRGFAPSPGGYPNLVKIIVSHTTSYIVSFNFLCQAVQELNKINVQTTLIGLHFYQLSDFYIKRSRRS